MADKSKALAIKLALYKFRVGSLSGKRPKFSSGLCQFVRESGAHSNTLFWWANEAYLTWEVRNGPFSFGFFWQQLSYQSLAKAFWSRNQLAALFSFSGQRAHKHFRDIVRRERESWRRKNCCSQEMESKEKRNWQKTVNNCPFPQTTKKEVTEKWTYYLNFRWETLTVMARRAGKRKLDKEPFSFPKINLLLIQKRSLGLAKVCWPKAEKWHFE